MINVIVLYTMTDLSINRFNNIKILDINPTIGFTSDTYVVICRDNIVLYVVVEYNDSKTGLKNIITYKLDTFGYVKADNALPPHPFYITFNPNPIRILPCAIPLHLIPIHLRPIHIQLRPISKFNSCLGG